MQQLLKTLSAIIYCVLFLNLIAEAQNAVILKNINPYNGSTSTPPVITRDVDGGVMYFSMEDGTGIKLWRTDGSTSGTIRYADAVVVEDLRVINGLVYFKGRDAANGDEPWRSDGTPGGTFLLKNIARKTSSVYSELDFVPLNGKVYFKAAWLPPNAWPDLSRSERYLLESDGTAAGTLTVASLPQDNDLCLGGGGIFIHAVDMWLSDGSRQGTVELADICSIFPAQYASCATVPYAYWPAAYGEIAGSPVVFNGVYYAVYGDDQHGFELWRSDGTAAGTAMVYDLNPGAGSSSPSMLTVLGSDLFCAAYTPATGTELWRFPLSGGAPQLVKDINPGAGNSEPFWLTEMNGKLYFSAYHPDYGRELWESNGTAAGTILVKDINTGLADANPGYTKLTSWDEAYMRRLSVMNGLLYFPADDGNGYELWVSDGTASGTNLAADVNPLAGQGSDPRCLTVLNGQLLFLAYEPVNGWEWWSHGAGGNQPPIASASAVPLSGYAPLTVDFSSAGSYDPDGSITAWLWDFGDNSSSAAENPVHIYQNPGTYTVLLTVTDNNAATGTDHLTITVHAVPSGYVHVADQTISRISYPGNKIAAQDIILIKDDGGQPVPGALVAVSYAGPTSGTVSGTTDANGEVTVETGWTRNPSGTWCFTVTDVQVSGKIYDPAANAVTMICEGTPKSDPASTSLPTDDILEQNHPNPFNSATTIRFRLREKTRVSLRVYDLLGREIHSLVAGTLPEGEHNVLFNGAAMPAGMYMFRLSTGDRMYTRWMTLRK
ncbi:MAG: PKD domain-containing protein [Bacteroidetes bacterium]|nr:PKD domain-containing protein [Bacteroidota bacterium]